MGIDKVPASQAVTKVTQDEIIRSIKKNVKGLIPDEMLQDLDVLVPDVLNIFRPKAWSPKENIITVWRNGKPEYYEVPSDLAKSLAEEY